MDPYPPTAIAWEPANDAGDSGTCRRGPRTPPAPISCSAESSASQGFHLAAPPCTPYKPGTPSTLGPGRLWPATGDEAGAGRSEGTKRPSGSAAGSQKLLMLWMAGTKARPVATASDDRHHSGSSGHQSASCIVPPQRDVSTSCPSASSALASNQPLIPSCSLEPACTVAQAACRSPPSHDIVPGLLRHGSAAASASACTYGTPSSTPVHPGALGGFGGTLTGGERASQGRPVSGCWPGWESAQIERRDHAGLRKASRPVLAVDRECKAKAVCGGARGLGVPGGASPWRCHPSIGHCQVSPE